MAETNETTTKKTAPENLTLGEIQARFHSLWDKARLGLTTPEENEWMRKVQEDYWDNPNSLANLYRR